jgi:hypothetical protein
VPAQPAIPQLKVLKTDGINLQISDLPGVGGFTLEVGPPAVAVPLKIVLNASGIELSHGCSQRQAHPGERFGQQRRAGGDLMPGFLLHAGATVMCMHAARPSPYHRIRA